jgi:hypothetical protein
VKDRAALDAWLAQLRARLSRDWAGGSWVRVGSYQLVQGGARTVEAVTIQLFALRIRIYFAVVGDWFVVTNDRGLVDQVAEAGVSGEGEGNLRLEITPERWKAIGPAIALAYEEDARRVCLDNLGWIEALHGASGKPAHELEPESLELLGVAFACPDGGRYAVDAAGEALCALHGTKAAPRQNPRPQPGSSAAFFLERVRRITATLAFTPDGISTRVRVE